jgi:hypothetical protein
MSNDHATATTRTPDPAADRAPAVPPAPPAPPVETLSACGHGKDGALNIVSADDKPALRTVRGGVGLNNALKHVAVEVGGGTVAGLVSLSDREGVRRVNLNGANGSLNLVGSQLALQSTDHDDQIILGASSNRSAMFIGSNKRPGFIQLTTGGNPGPTVELDGERNSLLFLNKGSRTDSVLTLDGNAAAVRVGSSGRNGTVSVLDKDGNPVLTLDGNATAVRAGGSGRNGTVSVFGKDGQPLLELLGRDTESVMGLGQANRPGRISMYSAKGEAIRLDAASGDIMLSNADCAEEFDLADPDVEPGTLMVLAEDGRLVPSSRPYDTSVVGVVSGAGSYRPGLVLDRRDTGAARAPIALMGKVYCWVDAEAGPVGVGDLLTTAERPGHAMRVTETVRAIGAIFGKALAPLTSGCRLVPVLVTAR